MYLGLGSSTLSTQFCPTETVVFPCSLPKLYALSTQFCPTETRKSQRYGKPRPTFHTILSYGNEIGQYYSSSISLTSFHTILSYGNPLQSSAHTLIVLIPFHTILSYGNNKLYNDILVADPDFPHNNVLRKHSCIEHFRVPS